MHFVLANIVISVIIEFYLFQNPYTLFYCEQWKAENIIFIDEVLAIAIIDGSANYNRTYWAFPLLQASQPCLRWSISRDFFQRCFSLRVCFLCALRKSVFFLSILFMQPQDLTFVSLSLRSLVFAPFTQCYLQLGKRKHYFCFFLIWYENTSCIL